jgi:hypothetical protein
MCNSNNPALWDIFYESGEFSQRLYLACCKLTTGHKRIGFESPARVERNNYGRLMHLLLVPEFVYKAVLPDHEHQSVSGT